MLILPKRFQPRMVEKAKKNRQIATNIAARALAEHDAEGGLGQVGLA